MRPRIEGNQRSSQFNTLDEVIRSIPTRSWPHQQHGSPVLLQDPLRLLQAHHHLLQPQQNKTSPRILASHFASPSPHHLIPKSPGSSSHTMSKRVS